MPNYAAVLNYENVSCAVVLVQMTVFGIQLRADSVCHLKKMIATILIIVFSGKVPNIPSIQHLTCLLLFCFLCDHKVNILECQLNLILLALLISINCVGESPALICLAWLSCLV